MGLRREILQVFFGAFFFALALQLGVIKSQGPFWDNVLWGMVIMFASRLFAYMLGGKGK